MVNGEWYEVNCRFDMCNNYWYDVRITKLGFLLTVEII